MFYIVSVEKNNIDILDSHIDLKNLEHKLKSLIIEFFNSKNISSNYEDLFNTDPFYLVKNENGSFSIHEKIINKDIFTIQLKPKKLEYIT